MEFPVIRYTQNSQDFLSLVLPFSVLDQISEVLIYGNHPGGYQRKPNSLHLNRIKKYALENKSNFVLPTSIILGGTKDEVEPMLRKDQNTTFINIDPRKKVFRIVDGQHRIAGLREAARTDQKIMDFPINVIVVLSDKARQSVELEVFTDINSKGKKINTDLAQLAKHDYEIREKHIEDAEVNRHISIKVAYFLKEKDDSVWHNAIKFDIHSEVSIGIIGITIFSESIKTIVDRYISDHPFQSKEQKLEGQELIDYCNDASNEIGEFLYKVWNQVIKVKWAGCFTEDIVKNDDGELVKIFYHKDYYIQKGLGIKSLNPVIGDLTKRFGLTDISFHEIKVTLLNSKVKIEDWKIGGPFAGFNSESGFSKIRQILLNNQPVPALTLI